MSHEPVPRRKDFLKELSTKPGVYLMLGKNQQILYVGKAKNLKKRVKSYFQKTSSSLKTQSLVNQIIDINVIVTQSEIEALILECNLIKKHNPRYNVLMRDDKSYPYLFLSKCDFPRLVIYRGAKRKTGKYFGPYPSSVAAKETLNQLQKLFKIRQCDDSYFRNRSRPCLQYQIKRCSAPCVGYISKADYSADIARVKMFLQGKSQEIINDFVTQMEEAAQALNYEKAALLRDQVGRLNYMQKQQAVAADHGDVDIVGVLQQQHVICVNFLFVRAGRLIGNKSYFPKIPVNTELIDIWNDFLPQYYLSSKSMHEVPPLIITTEDFPERLLLGRALTEKNKSKVMIRVNVRGARARWQAMVLENAAEAIRQRLAQSNYWLDRFSALKKVLAIADDELRIECFDVSHTQGKATMASCVVFGRQGPIKSDYRRYNINNCKPGDDYAALKQALMRRYKRIAKEKGNMPDILLIDGGKGQLHQAEDVLQALAISSVMLMSIAKGAGRKPGLEKIYRSGQKNALRLTSDDIALHLLQQIRDEAHRFAITGHRQQRSKQLTQSLLDTIPGVGPKRRKRLLLQFGGWQGLKNASLAEISKVEGIGKQLAEIIYTILHGDDR